MTPIPVDVVEGPYDLTGLILSGAATIVSLAAVIVSVVSSVLSRRDARAATKRADAAEEALRTERLRQDLEQRASSARTIRMAASYLDGDRVNIRVWNAGRDPVTGLEIGSWDEWSATPEHRIGRINPVLSVLQPGDEYEEVWLVAGLDTSTGSRPRHPPIVISFTDVYLQDWQLANGQHLRLISEWHLIENDALPHLRAR